MTDPRPRPQYGEYATPDEVAALRGPATPPSGPPPGPPAAKPVTGGRRFDRPVTIALLFFGVFNLIQSAPVFLDFGPTLKRAAGTVQYGGYDLGALEFGDSARIGGYVLLGASIVLLLIAAALSYVALARGRIAFWIPLLAGALTVVCYLVVIGVVLYSTPGFLPVT